MCLRLHLLKKNKYLRNCVFIYTVNLIYKLRHLVCSLKSTSDAKRLIGRKFDDAVVQSDMKHWPFKVVNDSSKPKMEVEYKGEIKTFYPEEISSMVLTKMKEISEAYLGKVANKYMYKTQLERT